MNGCHLEGILWPQPTSVAYDHSFFAEKKMGNSPANLLFVHDHRFAVDDEGLVYSPGKFPYEVWQRYLSVFEHIVVVGRRQREAIVGGVDHLSRSSGPGVSFRFLPSLSSASGLIRDYRKAKRAMLSAVRHSDAIIARLPSELGLLAIECAETLGRPWLVELVGCAHDAMRYHGSVAGRLYAPISRQRVRSVVRRSPFVVYVTERFLQTLYPTNGLSTVCSNVEIQVDERVPYLREKRLTSTRRNLVIGTIAPLDVAYKGLAVAFDAVASLVDTFPDVCYRVLGGGDSRVWQARARDLGIERNVEFSGTLPAGAQVNGWLDALDLYIQPSLTEGLPRSLIEAMARGCPALGSRAGGIPELLDDWCTHPPGDTEMLREHILAMLSDPEKQKRAGLRNFNVAKQFSPERIQRRRAELLQVLRHSAVGNAANG